MKILLALTLGLFCFSTYAADSAGCKISGCASLCVRSDAPEPPDSCAWTLKHRCYAELGKCGKSANGKCEYAPSEAFDTCLKDPEKYFAPASTKHNGDIK